MIALVDCNNFYASCERIFKPHLDKKPIAVLSNNDGCVIARSNESKSLGLKMGEPIFKKRYLVDKHNIHLFSSNFALYGDISKRVFDIVGNNVPSYEIYSIDGAFLDFSGIKDPYGYASHIREKVKRWTGIPISIGISYTKTLSKVAGYIAKKSRNGINYLKDKNEINEILRSLPLDEIWGIGIRYAIKMKKYGIHTAADLLECDETWIRKMMNVVGLRMVRELKCIPHFNLNTNRNMKKSICTSRSFGKEIKEFNNLREAVCNFANNCARKLRKENSVCSKVSIFLMTNRFNLKETQHNPTVTMYFDTPTSDSIEIISATSKAVKLIYGHGFSYKKAGVVLHEIKSNKQIQMSCFDIIKRKKRNKLMKSIDKLNLIMGNNKIRFASQGFDEKWQAKRKKLSPSYTTKYEDILKIKI